MKQKSQKNLWHSFLGISVVILAIILAFFFFAPLFSLGQLSAKIPFDPIYKLPIPPTDIHGGTGEDAGTSQIIGIVILITKLLKYFAGVLAFVWMVWSGMRMVSAGDSEDQAKQAQSGVIYSILALMLIVLVEPLITNTLYGGGANFDPGEQLRTRTNIENAIGAGKAQIIAVIDWIKAIVVFLGVAYLIFSALQFMRDFGGEEQISKQKTVLTWMAIGFIVIAVDQILIEEVLYKAILGNDMKVKFEQNPERGIMEAVGLMKYFLQFLAAVALAFIVYGGVLMITSFTSEENIEKGKKILISAGIGFLIILTSYILVNSLATGSVL